MIDSDNDGEIITLADIHVYGTLSNEYRAYVRQNASLEAFGLTRESALDRLAHVLARNGLAFDLAD